MRKQLQAYSGDNSEQAKSTIQKLQNSLSKAEQSLAESEYERYISDQEQMLDTLYNQTEEWVNQRLDNLDGLVAESIDATNKNAETISNTITEASNAYGYKISEEMESIWNSANDVVSVYGDVLYGVGNDILLSTNNISSAITGGTTNVISTIETLNVSMKDMIASLNNMATANANSIAALQNAIIAGQKSTSIPTTPIVNTTNIVTVPSETTDTKIKIPSAINKVLEQLEKKKKQNTSLVSGGGGGTKKVLMKYATGTTNAQKGFNLVSDGNGDEIIITNDGNAVLAKGMQLFPFEGGETVFDASKTAELLKGSLVPLNAEQMWGNIVKTPSFPNVGNDTTGNVTNYNQFSFDLPNVVDANSLITELQHNKRFEKIIDSMTAGAMLGKNTFDKYKY